MNSSFIEREVSNAKPRIKPITKKLKTRVKDYIMDKMGKNV